MEGHAARYAEVSLIYEGKNISRDIAPYMVSFSYTDNSADKADDISLTLEDRERLWCSDWFPSKGDTIKASIIVHGIKAYASGKAHQSMGKCEALDDSGRYGQQKRTCFILGQQRRPVF